MTAKREYTPALVSSDCITCGKSFSYMHATGMRKKHCTEICRAHAKRDRASSREASLSLCSVDGCCNPAARVGSGLCDKHYCRIRRGAPASDKNFAYRYKTGAGYISLLDVGHPLAKDDGRIYEHRAVAYEKHGGDCPGCFWCGVALAWGDSVIDHLDENKSNNATSNLVVACTNCNRARGAMLPFLKGMSPVSFAEFVAQAEKYRERQRQADDGAVRQDAHRVRF